MAENTPLCKGSLEAKQTAQDSLSRGLAELTSPHQFHLLELLVAPLLLVVEVLVELAALAFQAEGKACQLVLRDGNGVPTIRGQRAFGIPRIPEYRGTWGLPMVRVWLHV